MGEFGEKPRKKHKRHYHVRLSARAIAEGWDVPIEQRPQIVQEVVKLALGDESARDKLRAAEALMRVPNIQISAANLKIAQDMAPGSESIKSLIDEMEERDNGFDATTKIGSEIKEDDQ